MTKFNNVIQEGCVYRIYKFPVLPCQSLYRLVRKDIFIKFLVDTSIVASHLPSTIFQCYVFELFPFSVLGSRVGDDKYLTGSYFFITFVIKL